MPGAIFLSYRRATTSNAAGRLADRLMDHFGEEQVFVDVDAIQPGADWVEVIEKAVAACRVLLVVIGPTWHTETGPTGSRRLHAPNDPVAIEVRAGLANAAIRVIPVLVDGARMPQADDLPADLRRLARITAAELEHASFRRDAARLVKVLERVLAGTDAAADAVLPFGTPALAGALSGLPKPRREPVGYRWGQARSSTPGRHVRKGPYDDGDPGWPDVERMDFGALRVPIPAGGQVSVEAVKKVTGNEVRVLLPPGVLTMSVLAASAGQRLWPELASEIADALRDGGASIDVVEGEWGREIHARTGMASSTFLGVDGREWVLYGVATGLSDSARELDGMLREMVRGTVVVRGRQPYAERIVLPLTIPSQLAWVPAASVAPRWTGFGGSAVVAGDVGDDRRGRQRTVAELLAEAGRERTDDQLT